MLDTPSAPPATAGLMGNANPYPGLRPFGEADERLFFGREREIAAILALLEEQQLVVVHGASGCGKSSVVRAGVVPVFRLDALANDTQAHVIIIRPADTGGPLRSLARKLEREFPRGNGECSWSELLVASPDWHCDIAAVVSAAGSTLCLVVDQFEEIFAVNRGGYAAEARRLIEFLVGLGEPATEGAALGQRPLSVILTMRSDYLGHCALWDGFAETVNRCQYLLPKISPVGLLRSIHEPARLCGGKVTEEVADRLVPLMGREVDGLPILQHALMRAWRQAPSSDGRRILDTAALDAIGGIEHALSRHAEEAFRQATRGDAQRTEAANWIFRALSDLDTDGRIIRRSLALAEVAGEAGADEALIASILEVFRGPEFNLVMPPQPEPLDGGAVVSVSHEALLRQWDRITDIGFDENGRPRGLVYREFQDGMIARALSVQAQSFVAVGAGVLGPAATEQRLPWFHEVERRPGWLMRYPLQRGADPRRQAETQMRDLVALMTASQRNMEAEREKLKAEQEMVARLRRTKWIVLLLSGLVLALMAAVFFISLEKRRMEQVKQIRELNTNVVTTVQLNLANEMARRYCLGQGLKGKACPPQVTYSFLQQIQSEPSRAILAPTIGNKQFVPEMGDLGHSR